MRICKDCMKDQFDTEEDRSGSFPGLTVIGAALGGVAAALTGSLVLFPLALLAGFGGDLIFCDVCGRTRDPDDMFQVMEKHVERDDEFRYVPVRSPYRDKDEVSDGENPQYAFDENSNRLVPIPRESLSGDNGVGAGFDWSLPPAVDSGDANGPGTDASPSGGSPATGQNGGGPSGLTGPGGGTQGGTAGGGE